MATDRQPTRRGTPRTSSRPDRKRTSPAPGSNAPRVRRGAPSAAVSKQGKPAPKLSPKGARPDLRVRRSTPTSSQRVSLGGKRPAQKGSPEQAADVRRSGAERAASGAHVRHAIVAAIVVAAIALAALLGWLLLSYTPAFTILEVTADSTEHVSSANIVKLANIPSGSTLLNLDEAGATANLRKNPWVGEVSYVREFPSTLKISVTERTVDSLVVMSTGNMAWCLGNGNVWIEPVSIPVGEGRSVNEAALAKAREMGALLITGVPPSVSPVAGSKATDDVLEAIAEYRRLFSQELSSQIVSFSASGLDSISCVLATGVEISLGPAANVESKESVVRELLAKHAGKITYINVRVPSKPSYRMVSSENVQQGSGTEGTDYPDPTTSPTTSSTTSPTTNATTSSSSGSDATQTSTTPDGSETSGDQEGVSRSQGGVSSGQEGPSGAARSADGEGASSAGVTSDSTEGSGTSGVGTSARGTGTDGTSGE